MDTPEATQKQIKVDYEQGELCWLDAILALQTYCALPPKEAEELVEGWEEGLKDAP